jgi:hypothetical protein
MKGEGSKWGAGGGRAGFNLKPRHGLPVALHGRFRAKEFWLWSSGPAGSVVQCAEGFQWHAEGVLAELIAIDKTITTIAPGLVLLCEELGVENVKQLDKAIAGILIGGVALGVLSMIANNPRISPMWRSVARTAEGDIFQHVLTGELALLA